LPHQRQNLPRGRDMVISVANTNQHERYLWSLCRWILCLSSNRVKPSVNACLESHHRPQTATSSSRLQKLGWCSGSVPLMTVAVGKSNMLHGSFRLLACVHQLLFALANSLRRGTLPWIPFLNNPAVLRSNVRIDSCPSANQVHS
jgi:hypothetical protein